MGKRGGDVLRSEIQIKTETTIKSILASILMTLSSTTGGILEEARLFRTR